MSFSTSLGASSAPARTVLFACCRHQLRCSARFASTSTSSSAPSSSTSISPSKSYTRPIPAGSSKVYDEALLVLQKDKESKLARIQELRKGKSSEGVEEEILGLEIASEINDPEVRWRHRNGLADLSKPVYRYLAEQSWRSDGPLGILMQRVEQMNVVPDVLGSFEPDANIVVSVQDGQVTPGVFLVPSQTMEELQVAAQVYHPEDRQYTLLMVDPDSPDAAKDGYKTVCHWAISNITLSATTTSPISSASGSVLQAYTPPHPQRGTPYHRYTLLLLEQSSTSTPQLSASLDKHFDARAFIGENGLKPVGITFFREKWDANVSKIYKEVLNTKEEKYGRPKKVDRYR